MNRLLSAVVGFLLCVSSVARAEQSLPFDVVFKGHTRFDQLVEQADAAHWSALPIGDRTAVVGKALVGTPYKSYTLEIDDRIEAPSANFEGMDCWTFFEISLAFARMLDEPREKWTPQTFLKYIELDRYRNGKCTGGYLSRLHYLEDWAVDNEARGLTTNLTKSLGGVSVHHVANEMTHAWKHYRYLHANPSLLPALARMEQHVTDLPMYHIPKKRVPSVESKLRNGDIICITSRDPGGSISTSHVGLAVRGSDGALHFMHASSPHNYGKVVIDSRLSTYLNRYPTDAGIMVVRPVK